MCASEPILPCSCAWNLPVQQGLFVPESGGLDGTIEGYKAARPGVGTSGRAYDHSPAKDK